MNAMELRRLKAQTLDEAEALAKVEGRMLTDDERAQLDALLAKAQQLEDDAQRADRLEGFRGVAKPGAGAGAMPAAAFHQRPTKDRPDAIAARFLRTGDDSAGREMHAAALEQYRNGDHLQDAELRQAFAEERASNDASMTVADSTNAGYLVPVGHYNRIIARRDETALAERLGIMNIPGVGTTVNVPVDNEADSEFVATPEQVKQHTNNFDRDAPVVDRVQMTLAKYTKKIELTDELLLDNDSNLMQWLEFRVGLGLAKTDNALIVTEALANGTAALTFDSAVDIGAQEVPELIHLQAEGYEEGSAWIMRRATQGVLRGKVGDNWQFEPTPVAGSSRTQLWGFPLYTTQKMPAIGSGLKSVIFGNFGYMGVRRMPGLTVLRDPYTIDGMVLLKYYYRVVFKVLQAQAIIYGTHATGTA